MAEVGDTFHLMRASTSGLEDRDSEPVEMWPAEQVSNRKVLVGDLRGQLRRLLDSTKTERGGQRAWDRVVGGAGVSQFKQSDFDVLPGGLGQTAQPCFLLQALGS